MRPKISLPKFMRQALDKGKYRKYLTRIPGGKEFWLHCVHKANKSFTPECEDIFKDWDELKGRQYGPDSKERFLNALKGSPYFTVQLLTKEKSKYRCKFNNSDEIAAKKAKKKERRQQPVRGCGTYGSDGESVERSPGTSCESTSTACNSGTAVSPLTLQDPQNTSEVMQISCGSVERSSSELLGSAPVRVISASDLRGTLQMNQGGWSNAESSPKPPSSFSDACVIGETESISNIPHNIVGNVIIIGTNDFSKSVDVQNTSHFPDDVEVNPGKPNPVCVGISGNLFNTVSGSTPIATHQFISTDVSIGSSDLSESANDYLAFPTEKESGSSSCPRTPPESLPTEPSTPLDILAKNITLGKTFSGPQVLQSNLNSDSADQGILNLNTVEETLNTSMDVENESADILGNRGWTLAELTSESSPLNAPIGHESSDVSIDILQTPLFSEMQPDFPISKELYQPMEVPHSETRFGQNTATKSSDVTNENRECDDASCGSQCCEMLFEDAMEVAEMETVLTDDNSYQEVNQLMKRAYEEMFPIQSVNCSSLEPLAGPVSEERAQETTHGENVSCPQNHQPQHYAAYMNGDAVMKAILEAVSGALRSLGNPGVQERSGESSVGLVLLPLDNGANNGILTNCSPSLQFPGFSNDAVLNGSGVSP